MFQTISTCTSLGELPASIETPRKIYLVYKLRPASVHDANISLGLLTYFTSGFVPTVGGPTVWIVPGQDIAVDQD